YRPGQWSPDGRGTREALSAAELASVARDASVIQQYPMVHARIEKAAATNIPAVDAAAPELPPSIVDLDLTAGRDGIRDRGPNKVAVTVKGTVEPFAEAAGRIRGVYLRGESAKPGTIELAPRVFRKTIEGKSSTIRVWIKPMAVNRPGGSLLNWCSYLFGWTLANDSTTVWLASAPQKKLAVNAVVRQRAWQCLTLVFDGATATLYLNGVPVGKQTWDQPLRGTDTPLTIGSITGTREFLNAKLAAFTIYEGALSEASVAGLYRSERNRFDVKPADYPEDDLFRLHLVGDAMGDAAEIPGRIEHGEGVAVIEDDGRPVLALNGKGSYLILRDHPRAALLHHPFTLVLDFRPAPGAAGMIFRRHHLLCLELKKDGALVLDADIGRRNTIRFPNAIRHGQWNRLRFSYDGKKARAEVNGHRIAEIDYVGRLATGSSYPLVLFADNTHPRFPNWANIQCRVRELRLMPDDRRERRP
ncbi:hypothetical protein HQ590_02390, partial [bacterium]|nr:hypothetical protein [bacterium]